MKDIKKYTIGDINSYTEKDDSLFYIGAFSTSHFTKLLIEATPSKIMINKSTLVELLKETSYKLSEINNAVLALKLLKANNLKDIINNLSKIMGGFNHLDGKYYIAGNAIDIEIDDTFDGIVALDENGKIVGVYRVF